MSYLSELRAELPRRERTVRRLEIALAAAQAKVEAAPAFGRRRAERKVIDLDGRLFIARNNLVVTLELLAAEERRLLQPDAKLKFV